MLHFPDQNSHSNYIWFGGHWNTQRQRREFLAEKLNILMGSVYLFLLYKGC